MSRRKAYTKVSKTKQIRESHVDEMGDTLFKGFQCLNPKCTEFLFVELEELDEEFECESCNYEYNDGLEQQFYEYELVMTESNEVVEDGNFSVTHEEYIEEA